MRVALVGFNFAEIVARLALGLAGEHEVFAFVSDKAAERELTVSLRSALEAAVTVAYLPPADRKLMVWHGFQLARRLRRAAVDVVHVQEASAWTVWAARRFQAKRREAFVLTVHDPAPHFGDEPIAARTQWANRRLRREADAIIVHGEALVRAMEALEPGVAGRVFSVAHGALGEAGAAEPPPGAGRFLFFGRIQAYKGLGVLLDAVEILARDGASFEVVIAGVGDDLNAHRTRIARLPQVRLDECYVPADEVGPLFASADAIVMPYLEATQSGVGALAMAAGRGVIATAVGAVGEVVRNEEQGLIVPPGDAVALAKAMARVLSENGLAARLGQHAARTAKDALNWQKAAAATVAVYERAFRFHAEGRRRPKLF